jgi:GTP diphosphokinase / guanosine-3',5'-bis(diphosphate) 3'-diphosphatase
MLSMGQLYSGGGSSIVTEPSVSLDGSEFFALVETYLGTRERCRVREAFELARQEHGDQLRKSGEPFFIHPLTVAYYLAEFRLDAPALIAALLHDAAEDTRLSIAEIDAQFGGEVARLVDGVTKLQAISAGATRSGKLAAESMRDATLHKLFEVMLTDVRVVIIKLFDRLHNMRTVKALPVAKQREKAEETLAIYAPLANRLGIWRLKNELEMLALEVLHNDAFTTIRQKLEQLYHEQQALYATVTEQIIECLTEANIKLVNVLPCSENLYTTYQALTASEAAYDAIDPTLRLVVLLEDIPSCYLALGYFHQKWRPVPGKFDDYIALQRDNLYRALHTTVIYSDGQPVKLRFRTLAMNEVSEVGVLARWVYAGTPLWSQGIAERVEALFANIRENIKLEPQDPSAAVKGVVEDVFRKQIMVYTPRGDVIELPQGATPIDFAYAIHTEVGNQCQAAYVNEQRHPLNKPLRDGDRVRIVKASSARPHRTWLDEDLGYIATSTARSHVRRWFRRLSKSVAIAEGRRLLQDELRMLGIADMDHPAAAAMMGLENATELYYALGRAELLPTTVATRVVAADWEREPLRTVGNLVCAENGQEYLITNSSGRKMRLCLACNAHPGDVILGFIRADGGVTVHKESCHTLRPDPLSDRTIKLAWGGKGAHQVRPVTLQVDVHDRTGLLFEIAELMQSQDINIVAVNTPRSHNGDTQITLDLEINSPRQLVRVLHRVHALVNVYRVQSLLPANEKEKPTFPYYLPE